MAFSTSREILFVSIYRGECLFMKKKLSNESFLFLSSARIFLFLFFFLYFFVFVCFFSSFFCCWIFRELPKVALLPKVTLLSKVLLSVLLTMSPLLD